MDFLGEWCVQQLDGSNMTFSCAQQAPLQEFFDSGIDSQCQAYFGVNNVLHAVCYCKTGDYCNHSIMLDVNLRIVFMSMVLVWLAV